VKVRTQQEKGNIRIARQTWTTARQLGLSSISRARVKHRNERKKKGGKVGSPLPASDEAKRGVSYTRVRTVIDKHSLNGELEVKRWKDELGDGAGGDRPTRRSREGEAVSGM